jgi:beta-xylosidase
MQHIRSWAGLLFCWIAVAGFSCAQPPAIGPMQVKENLKLAEIRMHDPWIVADQPSKTYYMYEGGMSMSGGQRRSGVIAYKSKDMVSWSGPYVVYEVQDNSWADPAAGVWAPEVHVYKGKYYLFATLNNYKAPIAEPQPAGDARNATKITVTYGGTGWHLRGTQIFESDSPMGPFKAISEKAIPPADTMSLDGTLYIEDGKPYMVYVHEWIQLVDGNMEAVEMSPDLTRAVGEPFYLFKASDAPWLGNHRETNYKPQPYVTDGPELYKTKTGKLLMIWSSYDKGSYVETLAHSDSGKLAGPWKQDGILIGKDSGHGMIFNAFDGRLMLVLHQPFDGRLARAKIYEIEDAGDTLRVKKMEYF